METTDENRITLKTPEKSSVIETSPKMEKNLIDDAQNQIIMPTEEKISIEEKSNINAEYTSFQTDDIKPIDNNETYNPNIPDDVGNDIGDTLHALRGDAIGNTLYSERFVISTILKLRDIKEPLENNESFEKDLEALWDMTIEKDVVVMLIEFDVFEIFTQCFLKYSTDVRLIEILVGIMGNMCSVADEALQKLTKNEIVIDALIHLITIDDSEVLIQLMRLYAIAYGKDSIGMKVWNERIIQFSDFRHKSDFSDKSDFSECFCYILSNSCNTNLLLQSIEALNVILAKNALVVTEMTENPNDDGDGESDVGNGENGGTGDAQKQETNFFHTFVTIKLAESVKQGFLTFHANENVYYTNRIDNSDGNDDDDLNNDGDDDFTESISSTVQKVFIMFLNIEEILFNYATNIFNEKTETELKSCLLIIISTISTPIFVLASNYEYLLSVLEVFKEFFMTDSTLHDEIMVSYVANVWEILRKQKANSTNGNKNGFDDDIEFNEGTIESLNKLFQLTHEVLKIMLKKYEAESLEIILLRLSPVSAFKMLEAFGVIVGDYIDKPHISTAHCEQLRSALSNME